MVQRCVCQQVVMQSGCMVCLFSPLASEFVMGYALAHGRDNEKAYVSVNDKICWTKTFEQTSGSYECGTNGWVSARREESVAVRCDAESVGGEVTVRVYTNLDGTTDEESFAIDNVELSKIPTGKDTGQLLSLIVRFSIKLCIFNGMYVCINVHSWLSMRGYVSMVIHTCMYVVVVYVVVHGYA